MVPLLLLTRPEAQSRRFAAEAARVLPPHERLIAPLSEIVPWPVDPAVFEGATGVILTSTNAVPALPALPGLTAWCVGPATAAAARAVGLEARDVGGDAVAMIETLAREAPRGPLVWAAGRDIARDLGAALPGLALRRVTAYAAEARDWPPGLVASLRASGDASRVIAPLFSPRAARLFTAQWGPDTPLPRLVAISPACAAALPAPGATRIAATPDAGGMLRALAQTMSQRDRAG